MSNRWQDDPQYGEFSEYGRGRFNIMHVFLGLGLVAMACVVLGAVIGIISALLGAH